MSSILESFTTVQKEFEAALKLLHNGKYEDAKSAFEKLLEVEGLDSTITNRISVYMNICENQTVEEETRPESEEDYLSKAAFLINNHNGESAISLLEDAEKAGIKSDSLHYLRAQANAQLSKYDIALSELKNAIKMRPENRILASNDLMFFKAKEEHNELGNLLHIDNNEDEDRD